MSQQSQNRRGYRVFNGVLYEVVHRQVHRCLRVAPSRETPAHETLVRSGARLFHPFELEFLIADGGIPPEARILSCDRGTSEPEYGAHRSQVSAHVQQMKRQTDRK
jgi:hypothetical protein